MVPLLLTLSGALELGAGAALLAAPSLVASLLLGGTLEAPAQVVARVAGAALLALGLACWSARREAPGRGMVTAMLAYNVGAVAVFLHAHFGVGLNGIGLWPAIILHTGLAGWCVVARRSAAK